MTEHRKALIVAFGSRGDVAPPAGIGIRLRDAGYQVTMAADKEFAGLIQDAGLGFRPLVGDVRAFAASELHTNATRDGAASRSGVTLLKAAKQYLGELNADVAAITADSGADVVLFNPLVSAAYHVSQALGIPSVGLHLQPQEPTAELPPMMVGRSLGRLGNRITGELARELGRIFFTGINDIRAEYGLPPTTPAAVRREQAAERWPILHGISPRVVPRPRDWRPGLDVVGYWWPPVPSDWTVPDELREFLDAGTPPVFVGFGSTNPGDVERLSGIVTAALRRAGRRGIIQAGWAQLSTSDDDMLAIGDIPHEWLFPRMAAVVHAAGAGTTAAGLRAGVPTVPIPMTGDGPFWSYRLTTLGVSPGAIRLTKLTTDRLADAVREVVTNPTYRHRAAELSAMIAAEDGAGTVLTTIHSLLTGPPTRTGT